LYILAGEQQVRTMLASSEFDEIRPDYDDKSRKFFPAGYRPPEAMSFAGSAAFFPADGLREQLSTEYQTQCELLFSDADYPTFEEVLAPFEEIRNLL
jgi:hypothetical protein